jgi:L-alanine-DL-glutamate epimerase-like enolase superfamily enzyme
VILTVAQAIEQLKTIAPTDTLYINWMECWEIADDEEVSQDLWIKALTQAEDNCGSGEDMAAEAIQTALWDLQGGHQ